LLLETIHTAQIIFKLFVELSKSLHILLEQALLLLKPFTLLLELSDPGPCFLELLPEPLTLLYQVIYLCLSLLLSPLGPLGLLQSILPPLLGLPSVLPGLEHLGLELLDPGLEPLPLGLQLTDLLTEGICTLRLYAPN
jgi:hypothetical protein